MALITCPDCGKSVSDVAPTCPHCGRPIKPVPKGETEGCFLQTLNVGCVIVLTLVGFVVIAVVLTMMCAPSG